MLNTDFNNIDYDPRDPDSIWSDGDDYFRYLADVDPDEEDAKFYSAEKERLSSEKVKNSLLYKILEPYFPLKSRRENLVPGNGNEKIFWLTNSPNFIDFEQIDTDSDSLFTNALVDAKESYGQVIANNLYRKFLLSRFVDENDPDSLDVEDSSAEVLIDEADIAASTPQLDFKITWRYAVTNAPAGLLSSLDAAVLERWANCAGLYREALAKINRAGVAGMIVKTPSGILRRSPLMDVIRDLAMEMKGYESEMGFTPASRSRVQVAQESRHTDDPWADIAG